MGIFNFFKSKKNEDLSNSEDVKINEYLLFVMKMINHIVDNEFRCDRSKLKDNCAIFLYEWAEWY